MKADYEAHVVVLGHRHGRRYAERKYLQVPVDVATGNFERLSDLQLRELTNDCIAEAERRSEAEAQQASVAAKTNGFDPFQSQIRGTA